MQNDALWNTQGVDCLLGGLIAQLSAPPGYPKTELCLISKQWYLLCEIWSLWEQCEFHKLSHEWLEEQDRSRTGQECMRLLAHVVIFFIDFLKDLLHLVILDLKGITIAETSWDSFDIRLKSPPCSTTHEEL